MQTTCKYASRMRTLQVRHAPEDVHRTLKARAAVEGVSLSDYVLRELRRIAQAPTRRGARADRRPQPGTPAGSGGGPHPGRARRRVVVLDASAVVELLLTTPVGGVVAQRLRSAPLLSAPHLLAVEVTEALRRLVIASRVGADVAATCLADLEALPLRRWEHEPLLHRVWQLRGHVTAYDAVYLALAESLEAPLVTTDARLARAGGHLASVELLTLAGPAPTGGFWPGPGAGR